MTLDKAHAIAERSNICTHGEMLDAMELLERQTDAISQADARKLRKQLEREDVI